MSNIDKSHLGIVTASFLLLRKKYHSSVLLVDLLSILEHLQKCIVYVSIDNLLCNEVVQSDTRDCDNEGNCSDTQNIKKI